MMDKDKIKPIEFNIPNGLDRTRITALPVVGRVMRWLFFNAPLGVKSVLPASRGFDFISYYINTFNYI